MTIKSMASLFCRVAIAILITLLIVCPPSWGQDSSLRGFVGRTVVISEGEPLIRALDILERTHGWSVSYEDSPRVRPPNEIGTTSDVANSKLQKAPVSGD